MTGRRRLEPLTDDDDAFDDERLPDNEMTL
jgi:hypothetical protein